MVLSTNALSSGAVTANSNTTQKPHSDHQISALVEWTNHQLLQIIRNNFNAQYVTQAPSLSTFRDAVSAHGSIEVDTMLLADFQTHVPLSNYESYRPFVDRFNMKPCKKEDVENLFAPGFPDFLAVSSATCGNAPKLLARYASAEPAPPYFDPNSKNPLAAVVYFGCMSMREIVDGSGQVVEKIPVCLASGQMMRGFFGWKVDDDESRMAVTLPCYAVPPAATLIAHFQSFLTIHGLFFLVHRDLDRFYVPFVTLFLDLIRYIDERWDTLVSCIRDGILPDLEGIDHVREHLQAQLHANPERAAELFEIGPPFSLGGWVTRVWPNVRELRTVCTGQWGMMLPKVRSILGPDTLISSPGYWSSESMLGSSQDVNKPDEFVLPNGKVIEFLDVSQGEDLENLRQAWEVEVGKQYEPVITTVHGLWRYQMGDIVTIVGFHPEKHSPIYKILGRKSMKIHLPHAQIADYDMLEAIRVSNSDDTIVVEEFTTVLDDRASPPTVGFIVELSKPHGPNAHLAPQKLFDVLVAADNRHQYAFEYGQIRLPTIRILRPGTFAEYRVWRARKLNISCGQFKIPTVLGDPSLQEWILERVIQEL